LGRFRAAKNKFYIFDDATYRPFNLDPALPTLLSLNSEFVIHALSFSKILAPGLRTAFVYLSKDLNKVFDQNDGTIYMALTSAPYDKLMSSTTMSNAILDFFSSKAFDNNFKINPTQLRVALRKAANNIKIQKTKDPKTGKIKEKKIGLDLKIKAETSLDDIQSQIKTALNPDSKSFADRKNFAEELIKLMAENIKNNPKATEQFGKLFSEGIQNKYFKGISKTGKLSISTANMTQAISEMFTEPLLKEDIDREKGGQVYAIVELNGKVKPMPSTKHESYPMAIESSDKNNKVNVIKIISNKLGCNVVW
jgi:hypothetical protein